MATSNSNFAAEIELLVLGEGPFWFSHVPASSSFLRPLQMFWGDLRQFLTCKAFFLSLRRFCGDYKAFVVKIAKQRLKRLKMALLGFVAVRGRLQSPLRSD